MSTISSTGIGSGLDVTSIITQLMAVERKPLTKMQTDASTLQSKVSAYGKMQSYVSAFRDAASKLSKPATWGAVLATSSDATAVSVRGSHSIQVSKLATSQTVSSAAFASKTTALGSSGTLSIQLGAWGSGTAFTNKSGSSAVDVTVAATDTLADVRDKINAQNAGVQASILTDASGSRLVMRSTDSGAENGFKVTASDASLAGLAFDDPASESSTGVKKLTLAAGDALATVNGLSVKSASNTLTDVIDGVSIKLSKVTTDPVDVSVASDTDSLKTAVTDFAKAYNDLASFLTSQTKYDASTKKGAIFQGDSAVNSVRSALRSLGSSSGGTSTALTRLSDVGLDIQADGSIKTGSTKLATALTKPDELRKLFADTGATSGLASAMRSWGDAQLSVDGALSTRQTSLQTQVSANSDKQAKFESRMTTVEARLRAQYSALDTQMSKINTTSNYITQQMTAWAKG
jgi:flagellar hook-associated protein 2